VSGRWLPWVAGLLLAASWWVLGTERALPDDHVGRARWTGDFLSYYLPNAETLGRRLAAGELPLWSPQHGVGAPFLASLQPGALYPPNLLHAVLDAQRAFAVLAAAHLALACGLAGAFAGRLGAGAAGAMLAGVAYAGSLQVASSIWSPPVVHASAWVPGLFLAAERNVARPTPASAAAGAVALGMGLLTGWPYSVVIGALGAGLYALARLGLAWRTTGRPPWRALAVLGGGALAGAAFAMPQLLPTAELVARSCRALGSLVESQAVFVDAPHDPARLLRSATRNGFADGLPGALALGLAPLALAAAGPGRRARAGALLAVGAFGLAASFPNHLPVYEALRGLPLLGDFRFPYRYRLLTDLALAVCSGLGAGVLVRAAARWRPGWGAPAAGGVLLALWIATATLPVWRSVRPFALEAPPAVTLAEALGPGADLPDATQGRVYRAEHARKLRGSPERAVVHDMEPLTLARLARLVTFFEVGRPLTVMSVEMARGPRRTGDTVAAPFYGRLGMARGDDRARLLDLLSATRVVVDADPPHWLARRYTRLSPRGARPLVYANPHALPRAVRIGAALPEPPDPAAALGRLADPRFDARRIALLDAPPSALRLAPGTRAPAPEGRTRIVRYEPERVVLETDGRRAAVVVLSDAHYPGWEARLDGAPVRVLRANTLFRAVAVPPGPHRIELVYRPASLRWGLALAGAAALGLGGAMVAAARRRAAPPEDDVREGDSRGAGVRS